MKKGLRRHPRGLLLALPDFNRRPDEEGIKTDLVRLVVEVAQDFNRRPDEEGIKTSRTSRLTNTGTISTADLMKKGLRLIHAREYNTVLVFQPQT